jgi:OB-fold nucleic acid binding domain
MQAGINNAQSANHSTDGTTRPSGNVPIVDRTPQLRQVWVTGEVSSMTSHPSGYFTLKDLAGKAVAPVIATRIFKNKKLP